MLTKGTDNPTIELAWAKWLRWPTASPAIQARNKIAATVQCRARRKRNGWSLQVSQAASRFPCANTHPTMVRKNRKPGILGGLCIAASIGTMRKSHARQGTIRSQSRTTGVRRLFSMGCIWRKFSHDFQTYLCSAPATTSHHALGSLHYRRRSEHNNKCVI
jgi:hypothetical protein